METLFQAGVNGSGQEAGDGREGVVSDLQSGQTTDARDKAGLRLVFDGYELSLNKDQNMLPKTACAMVGRVHSIAYIKYPTPSE